MNKQHGLPHVEPQPEDLNMTEGPRYCYSCEYQAEDGYDLYAHTWSEHEEKQTSPNEITCNLCEETFGHINDLMKHKKIHHYEKVAICRMFASGYRSYGDTNCWFQHDQSDKDQELPTVKCSICDNEFKCKSELLRHRKQKHVTFVTQYNKNDQCTFGSKSCWFIHDDHEDVLESEHSNGGEKEQADVIQKVFEMLEIMTDRITKMEKQNKDKMETL